MPDSCREKSCDANFMFHGCKGNPESGLKYGGFNEFAATNDLIMVYPSARCWKASAEGAKKGNRYTYDSVMNQGFMRMVDRITKDKYPIE